MESKYIGVHFVALLLMVFRIDWWWWGKKMPPVLSGWLSWPEIYHIIIWIIGVGLLFYTAKVLWDDSDVSYEEEKEGQ
jgi:hypothetical protein